MEKVLFVGNGINQLSKQGKSWNALMNRLAGRSAGPVEKELRKAKPFTLWFEELCTKHDAKTLKKKVAKILKEETLSNDIHRQIMSLDCNHILTTNYDYSLEDSCGDDFRRNLAAPENFFSLFRRRSQGSKHVWHIHGELDNARSIMLGHGHYSGYIHKIRNFLTTGVPTERESRSNLPYLSKFAPKTSPKKGDVPSWVDVFLENEVHIVGFSLDYTENHLWNLITEKQMLRKKRPEEIGGVVFHRCSTSESSPDISEKAHQSILRALGVTVKRHTKQSYFQAYETCVKKIREWK